ncbi:MAG: hypothetical protein JSS10_05360 [Verrucomicrobia bacterium]|nr:hypothetical protein [Verrucomicrobiota bacterium]
MSSSWLRVLTAAAPVNSHAPHPWICATLKGGQKCVYEALSEQKYTNRASKNTAQKIFCEKLTLSGIVYKAAFQVQRTLQKNFIRTLEWGDIFSADFNADYLLELYEEETSVLPSLEIVEKMCARSYVKHLALKTQGVWGFIKYYIWCWCYDKRAWVENLKNQTQSNPYLLTLEKAVEALRIRLFVSMEAFEDAAARLDGRMSKTLNDDDYKTVKDIKKKWITHYSQDKYDPQTGEQRWLDALDTNRKQIIVLYQIWDKLEKYQPSALPSNWTSRQLPTPLLEGASN